MAVCQNLVPLVNKIAGKWMFIPLKMVAIWKQIFALSFSFAMKTLTLVAATLQCFVCILQVEREFSGPRAKIVFS